MTLARTDQPTASTGHQLKTLLWTVRNDALDQRETEMAIFVVVEQLVDGNKTIIANRDSALFGAMATNPTERLGLLA